MTRNDLKNKFYLQQCQKTLSISKVSFPIATLIITFFLYQDIVYLHLPFTIIYRVVPIVCLLTYLALSFTILQHYPQYVIPAHTFVLCTGIFMILGIAYTVFTNPTFTDVHVANVSAGIQTVFIFEFIIAAGSLKYIPLLFLTSTVIFIILLIATAQLSLLHWTTLSNPIITALFLSVFAHLLFKINYNDFVLTHQIEMNEKILSEYKRNIEQDLSFASQIHRYLMPLQSPIPNMVAYYRPYYNLGGDFYDFIHLNNNTQLGILISDVSGHGITSAFITSLIKQYVIIGNKHYDTPHNLLYFINEHLTGNIGNNFVTALYCIIDFTNNTLTYSNAAHYLPLVITPEGQLLELEKTGKSFPLGVYKKNDLLQRGKSFETNIAPLQKGSKIILYTDGIIELYNTQNHTYIKNSLFYELLSFHHTLNSIELLNKIENQLINQYAQYINDDICIIIIDL